MSLSPTQQPTADLVAGKPGTIALCLSGGGFRAAIFHLGSLRRLNELGVLDRIDTISCVSGGSIVGAHLAATMRQHGRIQPEDWESLVERPFLHFVSKDLRTVAILRRTLPWNWLRPSATVTAIAAVLRKHLTDLTLEELPEHPNFVFNATEMVFGVNWESRRECIGHYRSGYASPDPSWLVARAVAASACFPPVFAPLPIRLMEDSYSLTSNQQAATPELIRKMSLTDGGVYDNLGIEPVWKDHDTVLVSDGGSPFPHSSQGGVLHRIKRYTAIIQSQVGALRKRWLIEKYLSGQLSGAYWSIGSATSSYNGPGDAYDQEGDYSKSTAVGRIARIRTDLDAFYSHEASVLLNHGYRLAETAVQKHSKLALGLDSSEGQNIPRPGVVGDESVQQLLGCSGRRRTLGRGWKYF